MPRKTRKLNKVEQEILERSQYARKVIDARFAAYAAQEWKTCNPDIKKAVMEALRHMEAMLLGLTFTPPRVSLDDVARVEAEIGVKHE